MTHQRQNRFVNNNLPKLQEGSHNPLSDYEDTPVQALEKAVENLVRFVRDVASYVLTAKTDCKQNSTLTWDEEAAIRLYTMPTPFATCLNQTLRSENQRVPKEWFPFLKLIITALKKLQRTEDTVWRGVKDDTVASQYLEGEVYTWWTVTSCSTSIEIVEKYLDESGIGTLFAIKTVTGRDISMFSAIPNEQEVVLMPGTLVRVKSKSSNIFYRFSIIHLEEVASLSASNYLFEQIRQEYQQNSRIELFMDPSKSFPIEQSYINLVIVEAEGQHAKKSQHRDAQHAIDVLGTFEQIYGTKTAIDVKNIFETCKDHRKQVLVFGRAGIGKSTFCRYIAYQWAAGSYWPQYELLALIPLRHLTADLYPPGKSYSLLDLVKNEVFSFDLTEKEQEILKEQFDAKKTLWILDGYDEVVQNVPPHLKRLFDQLLETPHHILTSRPYLNTLSYHVKMEITGFTDENITKYVQQFFEQMRDELDDAMVNSPRLLKFLRSNQSIWGVAHIPVNLELICSLWSNEDWSETEQVTITKLYTKMTEWLCRRYLRTHDHQILQLSKNEIDRRCQKELAFLESLAFNAMKSNKIIIPSSLLGNVLDEAKVSAQQYLHILKVGLLKSVNKPGINNPIEITKDHYFVHLSFQEYFAARYLINALKGSQTEKVIEFIKYQKYNQRYTLVFTFAAGLVSESDAKSYSNVFWNNILGEPQDLVGIRHMQLIIFCMEETTDKSTLSRRAELLEWIAKCIQCSLTTKYETIRRHLSQSLQRAPSVVSDQTITKVFIHLLGDSETAIKTTVLSFISDLKILNPPIPLITSVMNRLDDRDPSVRMNACQAVVKMGEEAARTEVITKLVSVLGDQSDGVRRTACKALATIVEKAATPEVITKLVSVLGDQSDGVRWTACEALGNMGEKAATPEVITKLVSVLGDQSDGFRRTACEALGNMGEKAATPEVITKLVSVLGDKRLYVREGACEALGKMGEKVATPEVITKLMNALEDKNDYVREGACEALVKMGEKVATPEVITKLMSALEDKNDYVRKGACKALGEMGEKVATPEVINKLMNALEDKDDYVKDGACEALVKMGEKAAIELVSALGDQSDDFKRNACVVLASMGGKAATNEVINKLVLLTDNKSSYLFGYAAKAVEGILCSFAVMKQLAPEIVAEICLRKYALDCLRNISEDELINVYLITKNPDLLPKLFQSILLRGAAVTTIENKIVVYGKTEPAELLIPTRALGQQLIKTFTDQREQLHLSCSIPLETALKEP